VVIILTELQKKNAGQVNIDLSEFADLTQLGKLLHSNIQQFRRSSG